MPDPVNAAQETLRETAAEFSRVRGALQQTVNLAVVKASPVERARVDALTRRAALIQQTIEGAGRMVDGARRWFADTFGASVENSVPLANPAIAASIQTSIAAMNYFLRDAKAELNAIIAKQKQFEALPEDKQKAALAGLGAETIETAAPTVPRWLWIGAGAVAVFVLLKGGE